MAHVTTAHRGDDVRIYEREARSLAEAGFTVVLVAPETENSLAGVEQVPIRPPAKARVRRFTLASWRAATALRSLDVDLYHFHDPELIPLAVLLARRGRLVVWDAHEDYLTKFANAGPDSWVPWGARQGFDLLTRALVGQIDKLAAAVVAATPGIAESYRNPRTIVVGNEARTADFAECRPTSRSCTVLFTGQASRAHLFPEVVSAIAQCTDLRLLVAGRSVEPQVWRAAVAALGDRVQYLGWLDRTGLREAIAQSSIGLATYAPLPTYQDPSGSPTKVFEFAAAGLPVVATPNPALQRLVGANGLGAVAQGYGGADIAAAMNRVLSSDAHWRDISKHNREWACQESWELRSEPSLISLYRTVLSTPARSW